MSATISTAPGPAAAIAPIVQATLAGIGNPGELDASPALPDAGNRGQFTALFQQLLGKQVAADAALNPGVLPAATAADADPAELTDTLHALLPFLEAAGLVQPAANNPAISAAKEPARNLGNSQAAGFTKLPAQALAAAEAVGNSTRASASAAGEFSAQLTTALTGAGEISILYLPGNPGGQPGLHPGQGAAAVPTLPVAQTVGAPGWGQELGNRITWMASRMESRADLILTPPHMGRIEVSLTVSGDQASAIFTSANPVVREALEAAMPRLREMLADAGIQLGQAQVGAENARQSAQQEKNGDNFASEPGAAHDTGPLQTIANASMAANGLKVGRGLVDVFA
ncbi:MAG: flagellar hook-length control protein FliK [Rhodocyclaceae bacterium]|nr:flagellar hook-length control protein FliK [Rhodocyclaceae bacterium]